MKKLTLVSAVLVMASSLLSFIAWEEKTVDVYYFHFSRRCTTCLTVEKVAKESVEALFPDKVKSGAITFRSINLDEDQGEVIGKKCNIEGQTLIVICGDKRADLTDKGFLYATSRPEKLKEEIRKAVEEVQQ